MALHIAAFEEQARWCRKLGSDFTARILDALVQTLDNSTRTGCKVINWPAAPGLTKDAVPLRLTGALHAMVLSAQAPGLAALYPPNPTPDFEDLRGQIANCLQVCDLQICTLLDRAPQTNEVARASLLIAGLGSIACQTAHPLALFEIGAAAGLNLNLDRFSHHLGAVHLGDATSAVQLAPGWKGAAPEQPVQIISRAGCDLNPIDIADPVQASALLSYVWPDQPERLSRMRAAMQIARQHPPKLTTADAADWVEHFCKQDAPERQTRVLMHSIAWQYMPPTVQHRITSAMETAAAAATLQSPLAWLAFELNHEGLAHLTLRLWPGAGAPLVLACADPHVRSVNWYGHNPEI